MLFDSSDTKAVNRKIPLKNDAIKLLKDFLCPHIMLFRWFACWGLFSLPFCEGLSGAESSCLYKARSSFTSSSTSRAWPQVDAASSRRRSASIRWTSGLELFPAGDPFPLLCARTSVSSSWVLSSFWVMRSWSWLMGCTGTEVEQCGRARVSQCVRISSMEAQRFFSDVDVFLRSCGVRWFSDQSKALSLFRGRLWDFPGVSLHVESFKVSGLERWESRVCWEAALSRVSSWESWPCSARTSSSWMRSSVSMPSEFVVEAWKGWGDFRQKSFCRLNAKNVPLNSLLWHLK